MQYTYLHFCIQNLHIYLPRIFSINLAFHTDENWILHLSGIFFSCSTFGISCKVFFSCLSPHILPWHTHHILNYVVYTGFWILQFPKETTSFLPGFKTTCICLKWYAFSLGTCGFSFTWHIFRQWPPLLTRSEFCIRLIRDDHLAWVL